MTWKTRYRYNREQGRQNGSDIGSSANLFFSEGLEDSSPFSGGILSAAFDQEVPIILLVEDNPDDELLTLRALRSVERTCDIRTAHDGAEAMEFFLDTANPVPSLVLLDLKLPKLNGVEVLERIRKIDRLAHVPVVVLTSSNERIDVSQCYKLGANSYIQKPVEFESFIETVRLLGLYWLVKNVRP